MSSNSAPTTMPTNRTPLELSGITVTVESFAPLVGRILLSSIFLMSAIHKMTDWAGTEKQMADKGMTMVPFFLAGAFTLELVGSLSLLLGYKARWGALLLILFLVPVTVVMHNFWNCQAEMQQMQMMNFIKNVAILGGLFLALGFGSGRYSADRCCR